MYFENEFSVVRQSSEGAGLSSRLQVGELGQDGLAVLLELGGLVAASLELLAERILWIVNKVADPSCHDEVAHANAVSTDKLATMVTHLCIDHLVELLGNRKEGFDILGLVCLGAEKNLGAGTKNIRKGVNDRIVVHRAFVVLRVVVAVLDAEHAKDGSHLTQVLSLAIDGDVGLR